MATYYIDPSSPTNGVGTQNDPFNTMPTSLTSYVNGDSFLFKKGTIYTVTWSSGDMFTVNREITLGAYGTALKNPIITCKYSGTSGARLFRVFNENFTCSNISFDNMTNVTPIYVNGGLANITITQNSFVNILGDINENAINIGASKACTNVVVTDNYFYQIANDAMVINSSDKLWILRNRIIFPSFTASNGDGIAVTGSCTDLWIAYNFINHTNKDTKQCIIQDGGTSGWARIEYNTCIGYFKSDSVLHTGIYCSLPGVIRKNFIKTWRSAIFQNATAGIEIYGNIILQGAGSSGTGAIYSTATTNYSVYNNTIICLTNNNVADAAIRNTNSDTTIRVYNNITNGYTTPVLIGGSSLSGNNVTDLNLSQYYKLLSTSSSIATGTFTGNYQDKQGTSFWTTPSIGANEYMRTKTFRS